MAHLRLHLDSFQNPTLAKSEFLNASKTILSVRGKTAGALAVRSSFQWSGGVRALTILAVRHRLFGTLKQHSRMVVSGEAGSPAAALDSALAKSAGWICEMFGTDSAGAPAAKRLIRRTNPERKRPGPVILGFSLITFPPDAIEIFVAGQSIEDSATLYRLLETLERPQGTAPLVRRPAYPVQPPSDPTPLESLLRRSCLRELLTVLRSTDIFSLKKLSAEIQRATSYASMRQYISSTDCLLSDIDLSLSPSALLGAHDPLEFLRSFGDAAPLSVASMPMHAGAVAVLQHFSAKKHVPLELDFQWITSSHLVEEIVGGKIAREPDLLTLNIGAAAWFRSMEHLHNYEVLMLMPSFSHRVMSPKGSALVEKRGLNYGTYHIMYQIPSSVSIVFDDLQLTGKLSKHRVSRQETALSDISAVLTEGGADTRAIVPFPFYNILHGFAGCEMIGEQSAGGDERQTVLCVHRRLAEDRRKTSLLDTALRDAWLELLEYPQHIELAVERLLRHRGFRSMLERVSGIHRAPWGQSVVQTAQLNA